MKLIYNIFILIVFIFTFSSCTLSKTFHHPSKILYNIKKLSYVTADTDTTFINYNASTQLLNLVKPNGNVINNNYTIKNLYIYSKSGNKLNAWFLKPKNKTIRGTIIHFHGSASNLFAHYKIIEPLINKGFQVLSFDYSGYGFSEGKALRKNIELDAFSAFNYTIKLAEVLHTKIILYGQSYGGYLATIVAVKNQNKIDALVLEGSFSSHRKIAAHRIPIIGNIVKQGLITKNEIKKIHIPLLIIHSEDDKTVPFKMGETLYKNANTPKELFKIKHKHLDGLKYYSTEILTKISNIIT